MATPGKRGRQDKTEVITVRVKNQVQQLIAEGSAIPDPVFFNPSTDDNDDAMDLSAHRQRLEAKRLARVQQ